MCIKCVRKNKRLGVHGQTYGQIKAMAHQVTDNTISIRGVYADVRNEIAVESHIFKIMQARTKRRYNRQVDRIR